MLVQAVWTKLADVFTFILAIKNVKKKREREREDSLVNFSPVRVSAFRQWTVVNALFKLEQSANTEVGLVIC